ncbi:MAG TPA: redoxin family protein [Candidatus Baltobacteraceae bacterium]|nr:redoxin family protein [Candidatus Baltobacteraceae bacterium]
MKNTRILLWISIVVVIVGVIIAIRYANSGGVQKSASQAPVLGTAKIGAPAPTFQAATNHGFFDLTKADKPVFLEVFATWCPHCQRQTAVIDNLYAKYKNRVDFVAVTGSSVGMDHQSPASEEDTLTFVQTFHVQYPVAFDGSLGVAKEYLQGGYPTMVVINGKKVVTYLTSGETPYTELAAALNAAL